MEVTAFRTAYRNSRPRAALVCTTVRAGAMRSSLATSEACRLEGTATTGKVPSKT